MVLPLYDLDSAVVSMTLNPMSSALPRPIDFFIHAHAHLESGQWGSHQCLVRCTLSGSLPALHRLPDLCISRFHAADPTALQHSSDLSFIKDLRGHLMCLLVYDHSLII